MEDIFANGGLGYGQFADDFEEEHTTPEDVITSAEATLSDDPYKEVLEGVEQKEPPVEGATEDAKDLTIPENPDNPWLPPPIEDPQQRLRWYEDKYKTLYDTLNDPGYTTFVEQKKQEAVEKVLSEAEAEIADVRLVYQALQKDPVNWLRQYVPGAMAALGYNPVMSDQEIAEAVDRKMAEEFGVGYFNNINSNDILKPGTLSRQMFMRQNAIEQSLLEQNRVNEQKWQQYQQKVANGELVQQQAAAASQQPQAAEVTPEFINNIYDKHFTGRLTREEHQQFIQDASKYQWGPEDVYNAIYFDDIVEGIRQEVREQVMQEIYNRGNSEALQSQPNVQQRRTAVTPNGDLVRAFSNNANPFY